MRDYQILVSMRSDIHKSKKVYDTRNRKEPESQ